MRNYKEDLVEKLSTVNNTSDIPKLVLYNDDINTFDHVIACLVQICNHTQEQAQQCAMLVHYKGKCIVKSGEIAKLNGYCESLRQKGLKAKVE